jgi:hypothetical protein
MESHSIQQVSTTTVELFPAAALLSFLILDNIYIADNTRIRKVTVSTGIITTIAGGGTSFNVNNGPATSAGMLPLGVALDSSGIYLDCHHLAKRKSLITPF